MYTAPSRMWTTAPYRRVVFETLVDARANSENHCDHLTITSAERASSVRKISDGFGKSIEDNQVENGGLPGCGFSFYLPSQLRLILVNTGAIHNMAQAGMRHKVSKKTVESLAGSTVAARQSARSRFTVPLEHSP